MSALPPHLPKKEKISVSNNTKRSVFYFVSCMLIAIFASLATVFITFSVVLPRGVPEVQFYSFEHKTSPQVSEPERKVLEFMGEREARLFNTREKLSTGWYKDGSIISTGVFLTSDGWVLFPLDNRELLDKKNLEVVDSRGSIYVIENIFVDENARVMYAKIKGEGLRFISFSNWDLLESGNEVIGKANGEYILTTLTGTQKNPDIKVPTEIWKPHNLSTLKENLSGIVFSNQGELIGVGTGDGLLPGWYIESGFRSLLSGQKLSYSVFPWKGQFVTHQFENGFIKEGVGFVVTDTDANKNGLKVGDVIVKIQDQNFSRITLSQFVLEANQDTSVQIIRDGNLMEVKVSKQFFNL